MMPNTDLGWLKEMKTRLYRAAPPKSRSGPAITSLQLWNLGQELMDQVRPSLGTMLALGDARRYRDGLMIALTAFVPLRRKNLAALDMVRHMRFAEEACMIVICKEETKTSTSLEFEFPALLLPYLDEYCRTVRSSARFRSWLHLAVAEWERRNVIIRRDRRNIHTAFQNAAWVSCVST
jgi:hypothetical protein